MRLRFLKPLRIVSPRPLFCLFVALLLLGGCIQAAPLSAEEVSPDVPAAGAAPDIPVPGGGEAAAVQSPDVVPPETGAVTVIIDGPKEARWTFDGKEFDSGSAVENVPTGKYVVSFADVPEWTKPADAEVTVAKDGTAALDGKYVRHVGSVSVTIDGPKEAKWTFDGKAFDSGSAVENVPTGKYVVSFTDVPEWTKPADAEVTVAKDGTATLDGKYVRHVGSVSVKIDGPKEAKWTFDGKEFDSGSVVENVPTGKYVVSFTDVPEWTRPADAEVTVAKDGTASLDGKYVRHVGAVSVKIDGPKEAKWTFDGKEFDSGSVIENVPTGKYLVSFADVPEWTKPADAEVTVAKDGTATLDGKYVRHVGSVTVTIDGPKEAKWTFDGKEFDSGSVIENVPTGKYVVSFADVPEWTKPADAEVAVAKDGTATLDGRYVRHVGAVAVKIEGPEDARWIFDGRGGFESGHVITSVPTGTYTVSFYDLPEWTKPADVSVSVTRDGTASVSETYIRHVGAVSVTIDGPKEAKWTFDGKAFDSGSAVENVPTGKYLVSFADVPEWTKPADAEVTVAKDGTASLDGKYVRHVGAVAVKIEGPEDARWIFDGRGGFESGHVITSVPTGTYTVSFYDLPEWTKPADVSVSVTRDGTASVSETYIRHVGAVSVTIDGPKEAKWTFDGKEFDSGSVIENVPTGKYGVSFADVPEWTKPADAEVTVAKDGTATLDGKYVRHVGSVSVKIDGPKEAKWTFDGNAFDSGSVIENVPTGKYVVSFTDVPEWTRPADAEVTVAKDGMASMDKKYVRHVGSVSVKIDGPEGAKWSLDGKGSYESGHVQKNIPTGKYTVSFTEAPDWDSPSDVSVTVTKDGMASMDKKYVRHVGAVSVKFDGPKEAKWSLGGKESYESGYMLKNVPTGKYTVSFSDVPDWTRPADAAVTVAKGGTASAAGAYVKHTGSVTVTIEGPKEARWALDGKGAYTAGQTAGGIEVGNPVLSFSEVPGWTKPENQRVTVRNGAVSRTSGTYVRHTGSVKVEITGTKDGRWSLDGKGNYPGGWTAGSIVVGTYRIIFSDVSGRIKPEPKTITVSRGATTTVSAAYTQNTGSITVTIDGPKEARWSIDGRGSYESGQTVAEILVGNRVISFSYVKGWRSPADRSVTVQRGGTVSASGVYTAR
ncbi:hypothetical protein C8D99_1269 [Aminivibrio pyruvatiphilus]|uniref:Uncharacterized protein n=1 Tax=Aminivibrio pyruvatiphilus TaxID=1005740 RepID=A0A4R8M123_9BACT|nr:hypothetical protein [Aminivibrio pyruvatiphilus]TDY54986.1 hypothetical protein C8D99_1269 [Aminivibrio pyruvatiphilus]